LTSGSQLRESLQHDAKRSLADVAAARKREFAATLSPACFRDDAAHVDFFATSALTPI